MNTSHILAAVATVLLLLPAATVSAGQRAEIDLTEFDWNASRGDVREAFDESISARNYRGYTRLSTSVRLNDESWTRYAIFHRDRLIAQGYERSENLEKPRFGTISDVVSYDNNYWVRGALQQAHGKPAFVDRRTRSEYSEEMGDDALRMKRAVEWDLLGERFRWEPKKRDHPVFGEIQHRRPRRDHNVVNVNPGFWSHYFHYRTAEAYAQAGVRRWRAFHSRAQQWITKRATRDGSIETFLSSESGSEPGRPKRSTYTSRSCSVAGESCKAHYSYYGGVLYKVEVDFSETKKLPRRGHFEKIGIEYYKHFKLIDGRLERAFGTPSGSKDAGDDLDNNRVQRRISNLTVGGEGFWSVWMDVGHDTLVRHSMTGEQMGAKFRIEHKLQYYFHDVARVIAERDAWEAETELISSQ